MKSKGKAVVLAGMCGAMAGAMAGAAAMVVLAGGAVDLNSYFSLGLLVMLCGGGSVAMGALAAGIVFIVSD